MVEEIVYCPFCRRKMSNILSRDYIPHIGRDEEEIRLFKDAPPNVSYGCFCVYCQRYMRINAEPRPNT